MTNRDHVWHILDDVLLLLAGQYYPTPERTYKLDGGWSLALADLKRCFADLRAKLALAEADRDAARKRVQECETRMMRYAIELAEMQAERDAARAGEARAVEALRKLANEADALRIEEYSIRELVGNTKWSCLRLRIDEARALDAQPALDWLAQQRAEAAAEALEDIAKESGTDGGKAYFASVVYREFPDRLTMRIGVVEAGELIMRAAALRAGAAGGADA
jgi:hypothetical protein